MRRNATDIPAEASCPGCGCEDVRIVQERRVRGRPLLRLECVNCGREFSWLINSMEKNVPTAEFHFPYPPQCQECGQIGRVLSTVRDHRIVKCEYCKKNTKQPARPV